MTRSNLLVAGAMLLLATSAMAVESFQITFGSRPAGSGSRGFTDFGSRVVEANNGDILVAGYGRSYYTDVGNTKRPMLARISREGKLEWTRIYDDLTGADLLAVAVVGPKVFMLTKRDREYQQSGNRHYRDRIELWRFGANGEIDRLVASYEQFKVHAAAVESVGGETAFLIVAADTTGIAQGTGILQRPGLYRLATSGQLRSASMPREVAGARRIATWPDGAIALKNMAGYSGEPISIVKFDSLGELQWEIPATYPEFPVRELVASPGVLYVLGQSSRDEKRVPLFAFGSDGEKMWSMDVRGIEKVRNALAMDDGGIVLLGSYENLPILIRISISGNVVWTKRFASAKEQASVAAAVVLSDGWLAVTGSTSNGHGMYTSGDSDAFLLVSDPEGNGLDQFATCIADADEIERLRERLLSKSGIEVDREGRWTGRRPATHTVALGQKLTTNRDCGNLSEQHLLEFLRAANDEVERLGLKRPSARSTVYVLLRPTNSLGGIGYREWQRRNYERTPSVETEVQLGREVVQYIAANIMPYTERMIAASERLWDSPGMNLYSGDQMKSAGGVPPFADSVNIVERFLEEYSRLDDEQQDQIRQRFFHKPLIVAGDPDVLHLWGKGWVLVGRNRVSGVFDELLVRYPELEEQIGEVAASLQRDLSLEVQKVDPDMPHAEYLACIRQISASIEERTPAEIDRVRRANAVIEVTDAWDVDFKIQGYGRAVLMRPAAASQALAFVSANSTELARQN